jgi:hypothetical protein
MEPAFLKELRVKCVECDKPVLNSDDFVEIEVRAGPLHAEGMARIHRECKILEEASQITGIPRSTIEKAKLNTTNSKVGNSCKRKRDEREERRGREYREEREREIRERDEQEHSLRPGTWRLHLSKGCYGLKKDFEALEKEANGMIEALAKKHNLTTEKKE